MRAIRPLSGLLLLLVGGLGVALVTLPRRGIADEPRSTGCPPSAPADGGAKAPSPSPSPSPEHKGHDLGRMHNVHQVTARFVRGSQPEEADDFRRLKELGVKVVVSVDGARPNVAEAHKQGLRYLHSPVGYGGMSRDQVVLLYKAFTTLEGPFYVHCHHGKHRGPAACAVGLMGVEGWTAEQAVAELKSAGTAARYTGLYAIPTQFTVPTAAELAAAPSEWPEVAPVPAFRQAMVEIDHGWERLTAVRKANWGVPSDHPDVAPRHEVVIFAEYLRELARRDEVSTAPADFRQQLADGEQAAWDLAKLLEATPVNALAAEASYQRILTSCTSCHTAHRD